MANLIDISFFFGELNIAQKTDAAGSLGLFIEDMEPRLLTDLLGYELWKAFMTGLAEPTVADKWRWLLFGKEFTKRNGILASWRGLINNATGINVSAIPGQLKDLDPIYFKIGDGGSLTPASGTGRYSNPLLENLPINQIRVHRNDFGFLRPTDHFVKNTDDAFFDLISPDVFGDTEEFTVFLKVADPGINLTNGSVSGTKKSSLIANYVYWHWMADQATVTTGTGEKVPAAANGVDASPARKMVRAWNQMVDWNNELIEYLLSNATDYPEFQDHYGRIPCSLVKKQNTFGI